MGKRYGRNQRRRHREEIAALNSQVGRLKEAHERESGLARHFASRIRELEELIREWDGELTSLFGHYTALRSKPALHEGQPIRQLPVRRPVRPRADFGGHVSMDDMTNSIENIRAFVLQVRRDPPRMSRLFRFIERDGRGGVTYAISEYQLATVGLGPRDVRMVAEMIANYLVDGINREFRDAELHPNG